MPKGELQKTAAVWGAASRAGDEVLVRIRRLARRQRNLLDRLSRAEELADSLTLEVAELEAALLRVSGGGLMEASPQRAPQRSPEAARLLRGAANTGVERVELAPLTDGSVAVRIDRGKKFTLPPALGELLAVLAMDSGITSDGLIGWKTPEEVAVFLSGETGSVMSRHAVSQNVYRLRKALFERGGVNPYLIQTSRRHGLRLALRQSKEAARLPGFGKGENL